MGNLIPAPTLLLEVVYFLELMAVLVVAVVMEHNQMWVVEVLEQLLLAQHFKLAEVALGQAAAALGVALMQVEQRKPAARAALLV
jgi:uncharacterized membrane protein (DUF2068 family)